jgi:dihydropteroate synthase
MKLAAGKHSIPLDHAVVMGILNVTPDSFSDGGRFLSPDDAIRQAERMIDEGAAIIDVGGESTRPRAEEVSSQQEIDRVMPVIENIVGRFDTPVSVDTSKPGVMQAAVSAGATIINDVYALRRERALQVAADLDAGICLMHMQGSPADMQENPHYDDVVAEVSTFLRDRVRACVAAGIAGDRLLVDPGFGFGKNDDHNLALLANLDRIAEIGTPLLVGLSRKRMLGNLTGRPVDQRVAAGIAAAVLAVRRGARIVRTHDVAGTADALKLVRAAEEAGLN